MDRRKFLSNTALAAAGIAAGSNSLLASPLNQNTQASKDPFKLNYAPHFGMFQNNAGKDLIGIIDKLFLLIGPV